MAHWLDSLLRQRADTLVVMDAELQAPAMQGRLAKLPLRRRATPQRAALAALAAWQAVAPVVPPAAWDAVLGAMPSDRREDLAEALRIGQQLAGSPSD